MIIDERECYKFQCPILTSAEVYRECIGRNCMAWRWLAPAASRMTQCYKTEPTGYCGAVTFSPLDDDDWNRRVKHVPPEER